MSFIKDVQQVAASVGKVLKKSYGPLDKLEPSSKDAFTLRYPLDVGDSTLYPHTLEFVCWKPTPVSQSQLVASNDKDTVKQGGGVITTADPTAAKRYTGVSADDWNKEINRRASQMGGLRINKNQGMNGGRITDWTRRAELSDIIVMYVPQQALIETFQNSYDEKSMTEVFGLLGLAMDAGSSVAQAEGVWNKISGLKPFLIETLGEAFSGSSLVGDSRAIAEVGLQAGGYATNPQLEVLYSGTSMRKFDMQFKLTPRSQREADEILMIIRRLKYHASPEYVDGNSGRFMIPPSYIDININYNGSPNERVPLKFSTCVLEGVSVDLGTGTDQFVTYRDGTPLEIGLMLRFTELEIMHKALREQGY